METIKKKHTYIKPATEIIEVETLQGIMTGSLRGNQMEDMELEESKSGWGGISWD